jgi:hypothetical protein
VECAGRRAALGLSFRLKCLVSWLTLFQRGFSAKILKQRRDCFLWQCERLEFEWKAPRAVNAHAKLEEFPITHLTFHLTLCPFNTALRTENPQHSSGRLFAGSADLTLIGGIFEASVSTIAIYRRKPRRSHPSLTVLHRPFFLQKPHQLFIFSFYPAAARVRTLIFVPFTHCRPES